MSLRSLKLDDRNFVRKLSSSKFNYWAGYVANITLVFWLLSRAWLPAYRLNTSQWIWSAVMGLLVWTFAEYILHRYAYHEVPSAMSVGHDLHHEEPKALLGVPWYVTGVILVGIYYGAAAIAHPGKTGVLMASCWAGYIGYCAIHHSVHHFDFKNKFFVSCRRHHMFHHYHPDKNWGITTDIWDRLFGTKAS